MTGFQSSAFPHPKSRRASNEGVCKSSIWQLRNLTAKIQANGKNQYPRKAERFQEAPTQHRDPQFLLAATGKDDKN
jgi:hypothetical protein